ncbi:hypothetical protein BRADI_3g13403v3 [Brachypodium distachyon]|uniref:Uncharacterized protein n=1 Tax=Brachypodium distachyon TaxID=15368 RepID=A0A2K2CWV7_BRADI|nr:hypothetical protein BRADI_3g13403v3 [Brachypodium distachyon]
MRDVWFVDSSINTSFIRSSFSSRSIIGGELLSRINYVPYLLYHKEGRSCYFAFEFLGFLFELRARARRKAKKLSTLSCTNGTCCDLFDAY